LENHLIRNHLRNMIILGIPMHAICGGSLFPSRRLRILDDKETFGLAGACVIKDVGRITLAYTIDGYIYGLETGVAPTDGRASLGEVLPISLPGRICRIERRKSYRVTCPEDEPVRIIVRSKDNEIETEVLVVSEDSVGLSLSPETSAPVIDSTVTMAIGLPRLGEIVATGRVRFIRDSSGSQGLVVRLEEMSEPHRSLLRQYVRSRRIRAQAGDGAEQREGSFILTKASNGRKQVYWCPAHLLGSIDLFDEALEVVSVDTLEYL
jgi:hypothetical protein